MDTLIPRLSPDDAVVPVMDASVAPPMAAGPRCAACDVDAVVHWRRRPTDDELAELVRAEQSRRDELLLLADPQLPKPEFPPLPTADGMTRTVYACGTHAVTLEAAALIHQSSCTAPNDADLPGCDCTPEPLPEPVAEVPAEDEPPSRLPAHWLSGGE